MKNYWPQVAVAVVTAVIAHLGAVLATPYILMDAAMKRISRNGERINTWSHPPRVSESSRTVVRPAPDLAYSACVYDLGKAPVRVRVASWDDYMSVSIYQRNSDNFFVINDRQAPNGVDLVLVEQGTPHPTGAALVVESPSRTGVILQRRVAPTQVRFDAAATARNDDLCAPLTEPSR